MNDVVAGGVPLLERELLPVFDALAPAVRLAVGDALTVELPLSVDDAVTLDVPDGVGVGVPVGVNDGVADAVILLEKELLPVFEALAPAVTDAVGDALTVELALTVVEAVPLNVLV